MPSLYVPNVGGIETFTQELANELVKRNLEVSIITKQWPSVLPEKEEINSIPVLRIPSAKSQKEYEDLALWARQYSASHRADVIHVIGARRCLPIAGLLLSKLWNVPLIVTLAGGEVPEKGDHDSMRIWEEHKEFIPDILHASQGVTVFSDGLKKNLEHVFSGKDIETIYAGLYTDMFSEKSDQATNLSNLYGKYIVVARRLAFDKGVDVAIRSFSLICHEYQDIQLVIAGDGTERENLEGLVQTLGLSSRVVFVGQVAMKELVSLLQGAVCTLVPSRCEGGGLINIEAQAAGCPVVATNVGGIPEYVSNERTGILVPSEDPQAMATAIRRLLDDKELRERLSVQGKEYSQAFDWRELVETFEAYYRTKALTMGTQSRFTGNGMLDGLIRLAGLQ